MREPPAPEVGVVLQFMERIVPVLVEQIIIARPARNLLTSHCRGAAVVAQGMAVIRVVLLQLYTAFTLIAVDHQMVAGREAQRVELELRTYSDVMYIALVMVVAYQQLPKQFFALPTGTVVRVP
jgi:hypothetical protein